MRIVINALCISLVVAWTSFARANETPSVHEITMAAPDIVRIEIREAPIEKGRIVKLAAPSDAAHGSWVDVSGEWGVVIGPKRDHIRLADKSSSRLLDRESIVQAQEYLPIGNRRVVAIYRKSVPWSTGMARAGLPIVSFTHFVYIKLDGPLLPGAHTVLFPRHILPPTPLIFDDKQIRSSSIHSTHIGYRADDVSKYGYLSLWLPAGPDDGAVDFSRYGLNTFQVINERGDSVFTGTITLRIGPKEKEPGSGIVNDQVSYTRADGTKYLANRAGTYVFGLDYSAWRDPQPGKYRLYIPQLGTSDTFVIGDNAWYEAARVAMAGLYHQRSGLSLDGRYGYSRPEGFTEESGIVVRQSKLPLAFSKEGDGFVSFLQAAKNPWITDEIVPDVSGGYQDAGDWDRRAQHIKASYLLLDVYEQLSSSARMMSFDTPASSDVLRNPIYRNKKFPDLVEEAIWNLDFFRRMQRADGAVRGGIESANLPRTLEPSWLESQIVFAYAPDPQVSFDYAAGAAKLAIVLGGLGEDDIADLFSRSAMNAWNWAEQAVARPETQFEEIKRLLALPEGEYEKNLVPILRRARDARFWAASTLFRLTGENRYNEVALQSFKMPFRGALLDGAWEYANARHPKTDLAVQEKARKDIVAYAQDNFVRAKQRDAIAYRDLKHFFAPLGWGTGVAPTHDAAAALIRAHKLTREKQFLATLLDGSAHILGANQIGMSFTTGLGYRQPGSPLHLDSIATGSSPPAGITIYGWANPTNLISMYWYVWGPKWAALSNEVAAKRVEPAPASLPLYEFLIDYPWIIVSAEYTVHQTIATSAAVWIYLQGRP